MKSKNYIYSAPDFEVLEIELEKAVLSGNGTTDSRGDDSSGAGWDSFYED